MRIGSIGSLPGINQVPTTRIEPSEKSGFGEMIKNAVEQVNNQQAKGDEMAQKLATGDVQDVHQVMLALEKASTSFGLTVQVRNKVLDAYQEIMRMQV